MSETREMYNEVNSLIGTIAKALEIDAELAAKAVENGDLEIDFGIDENECRFIDIAYEGKSSRLYQGAIRHQAAQSQGTAD